MTFISIELSPLVQFTRLSNSRFTLSSVPREREREVNRRKALGIPLGLFGFESCASLHINLLNKTSSVVRLRRGRREKKATNGHGGRMTVDELAQRFLASQARRRLHTRGPAGVGKTRL